MATVRIDDLADEVMKGLKDYAQLAVDDLKTAIKNAGETVKDEIEKTAPKKTGKYRKSWAVKKTNETSDSIKVVVHSKTQYRLTHLLENGHAKRGGGRVAARPHIAPAEKKGEEQLINEVERKLR
ncbi:HK97 gp10 family phage protein [Butyrivibrio sp. MB2005]|uniref:HK97 gp10 family phage protein n=1 Tax=Butyrivibrio sp. MB2005 TaxID=1280678 RepID=UPI000427CFC9|nr:HK97 gp10 family phage protein [Butyrivibrio sp. MB2005]